MSLREADYWHLVHRADLFAIRTYGRVDWRLFVRVNADIDGEYDSEESDEIIKTSIHLHIMMLP